MKLEISIEFNFQVRHYNANIVENNNEQIPFGKDDDDDTPDFMRQTLKVSVSKVALYRGRKTVVRRSTKYQKNDLSSLRNTNHAGQGRINY